MSKKSRGASDEGGSARNSSPPSEAGRNGSQTAGRPSEATEATEAPEATGTPPASPWAPVGFGAATLAVGVVLLQQAWQVSGDLSPQGPRFLPVVVAVGWILLAAAYVGGAVVGLIRHRVPDASERFDHLPRVIALVVLLVAYAYALEPLGYLAATSVFFAVAAAVLGSRQHVRDAVIAVALAVALYFLFSRSLGIYLPAGILPV